MYMFVRVYIICIHNIIFTKLFNIVSYFITLQMKKISNQRSKYASIVLYVFMIALLSIPWHFTALSHMYQKHTKKNCISNQSNRYT